ncbi:hypothetical protein Oscil6304_3307 [Oscillatoria acuminata PCC 6304]|uniref:Uncharacterized protein n=1 Tax=Oscillatoria acuminata PCC 6304 TaxID=56110 RepID=K9TL63_9CYAN|nr:hypothetical protein Oscil6304_3307 [Oscillatoria acuminata PCC 6304]
MVMTHRLHKLKTTEDLTEDLTEDFKAIYSKTSEDPED